MQTYPLKNTILTLAIMASAAVLTACTGVYQDSVKAPSNQELAELRRMEPRSVLKQGVFHMQQTGNRSTVRVEPEIRLKRPELPPFDVAYVRQPVEDIIIELANTAGESVVIPESIRNKTITVIHSGSDFKGMLDIVLSKVGYHYNYVDGVWYITKFPVKNYKLEVSQSLRGGSLQTALEPERVESDLDTVATEVEGEELATTYEDELWDQVEDTISDLITVGADVNADSNQNSQQAQQQSENQDQGEDFTGEVTEVTPEVGFGEQGEGAGETTQLRATQRIRGVSHLASSDLARPFYRITKSAGLVTVRAAPEAHRMIENYLEQVQQSLLRQILVEARILAIVKSKNSGRGVGFDGDTVSLGNVGGNPLASSFGFAGEPLVAPDASGDNLGGFLNFSFNNNSIQAVVQMLNRVGDVFTISSPSLMARNNQISRVAVTQQLGFAETTVETNVNSSGDVTIGQRTDEAQFRNAGTVFSVLPFVGDHKVQMRMRLSISSQSGDVEIRTSVGGGPPVTNNVPEISTNLIDQDMVMDYGRVHAVGGVIQSTTDTNESYVPGFNKIPGVREVFATASNQKSETEFVVLMRVSRS
mgnify:CR=1 FL=1